MIIKIIKGTFLENLLSNLGSIKQSDFIEIDQEIDSGEKVIDEMNFFERAIYTFVELRKEKVREDVEKSRRKIFSKATLVDKDANAMLKIWDDVEKLTKYVLLESEFTYLISKMMWYSISIRNNSIEDLNLGIRKGFKIVSISDKTKNKSQAETLEADIFRMGTSEASSE